MVTRTKRDKTKKISHTSQKTVMVSAYGEEEEVLDERKVHIFETDPAYVRVNAGVTKSLGEYEFLRVDVALTVPCYTEMVQETFDAVAEEVAELLADEVDNYLEDEE